LIEIHEIMKNKEYLKLFINSDYLAILIKLLY